MANASATVFLSLSLTFAAACSSKSDETTATTSSTTSSTTGGGELVTCEAFCTAILKLACGKDEKATCLAQCEQNAQSIAGCSVELSAATACALPTLACDADGKANFDRKESSLKCSKEIVAFESCATCIPTGDAQSCHSCSATKCCAERQAVYADASAVDYATCKGACADPLCADACDAKFPSIQQKKSATEACEAMKCLVQCGG